MVKEMFYKSTLSQPGAETDENKQTFGSTNVLFTNKARRLVYPTTSTHTMQIRHANIAKKNAILGFQRK